jgi:protein-disulfide isomerase
MEAALKVGTPAPEFELNSTPDQRVKRSDFRGQRVILTFYPADWSPVCGDQLALYNELRDEFSRHKAICIGISVDGVSLAKPVDQNDHVLGPIDAPVTLVEYGDFQCPHCRAAHFYLKNVLATMGDGVRFVFRHMPLTQVHPMAQPAAEAAEAAGAQGKFWPMHDLIYANQDLLSPALLARLGQRLGLDMQRFIDGLQSHQFLPKVKDDFMSAVRSGAAGTPSFFINGEPYEGSFDDEALIEALRFAAQAGAAHATKARHAARPRAH